MGLSAYAPVELVRYIFCSICAYAGWSVCLRLLCFLRFVAGARAPQLLCTTAAVAHPPTYSWASGGQSGDGGMLGA